MKSPLPKPYKTGIKHGVPIVKQLLHPAVKEIVDIMHQNKGCYICVEPGNARLLIDDNPQFKIAPEHLDDIGIVLNDQRHYESLSEYRLTEERYKEILAYYIK